MLFALTEALFNFKRLIQQIKFNVLLETAVMNDPCGDVDTLTTRALISAVNCEVKFVHKKDRSPTRGTKISNKELKEACSVSTKDFSLSNYVKLPFARILYLRLPLITISRQLVRSSAKNNN